MAAAKLGVNRSHLSRVIHGHLASPKLLARYLHLKRHHARTAAAVSSLQNLTAKPITPHKK